MLLTSKVRRTAFEEGVTGFLHVVWGTSRDEETE
jgi:hypothetical protein